MPFDYGFLLVVSVASSSFLVNVCRENRSTVGSSNRFLTSLSSGVWL